MISKPLAQARLCASNSQHLTRALRYSSLLQRLRRIPQCSVHLEHAIGNVKSGKEAGFQRPSRGIQLASVLGPREDAYVRLFFQRPLKKDRTYCSCPAATWDLDQQMVAGELAAGLLRHQLGGLAELRFLAPLLVPAPVLPASTRGVSACSVMGGTKNPGSRAGPSFSLHGDRFNPANKSDIHIILAARTIFREVAPTQHLRRSSTVQLPSLMQEESRDRTRCRTARLAC